MKTSLSNLSFVRFGFLLLMVLGVFTACAPKNYKALFYDYVITDDLNIQIGDKLYSGVINYEELIGLPSPVKRYAVVSGMLNNQRITELFFDYKTSLRSSEHWYLRKQATINDHVSAIEPIYEATGHSVPFIRMGSSLDFYGSVYARMRYRNLLAKENIDPDALTDLCVLKYLAQMVWYPTAFINKYNLVWVQADTLNKANEHSAHLAISQDGATATGVMHFDPESGMPVRFLGTLGKPLQESFSISRVEVRYFQFEDKEGYFVPRKCVARVTNDERHFFQIEMDLKKTLPVTRSKILDKDFMNHMAQEKKKYVAQKQKISQQLSKRELRKQKRALRREARRSK